MSNVELVPIPGGRIAVAGLELPTPPPARIYISGLEYRVQSPRVALPPLLNTVKLIFNWSSSVGKVAKNIMYLLKGAGSGSTSDQGWLQNVANSVMIIAGNSSLLSTVANGWDLLSVTAKDNGGTTAQATSTSLALPGTAAGTQFPPQVAVTVSWAIAEAYRGGKPRTYVPGVPSTAVANPGDSLIQPAFANNMVLNWKTFLNQMNATGVAGTAVTIGTVSYHTAHTVRPTPLFRTYIDVHVHERLDSQRRRSGKEAAAGKA